MQLGHQRGIQIWQGCGTARNKCPITSKPNESDRRQAGLQAKHPRLLCRQDARQRPASPAATLGEQGSGHEDIRTNTKGVCLAHAEQQVLHMCQGVRGQQPEGGGGHPLRLCARDHLGQLRATVF